MCAALLTRPTPRQMHLEILFERDAVAMPQPSCRSILLVRAMSSIPWALPSAR